MTQAIDTVKQSHLGMLVARHEELTRRVSNLKRQLSYTNRPLSDAAIQQQREQHEETQARYERIADELEALLPSMSEQLQYHITHQSYGGPEALRRNAQAAQWSIEKLDDDDDQFTKVSNALADTEGELESVRQQIKEARAK